MTQIFTKNEKASVKICGKNKEVCVMPKAQVNLPSPDFTLNDVTGNAVTLSSFKDSKQVVLVFNRGFA